jgi:hypothetical protein
MGDGLAGTAGLSFGAGFGDGEAACPAGAAVAADALTARQVATSLAVQAASTSRTDKTRAAVRRRSIDISGSRGYRYVPHNRIQNLARIEALAGHEAHAP